MRRFRRTIAILHTANRLGEWSADGWSRWSHQASAVHLRSTLLTVWTMLVHHAEVLLKSHKFTWLCMTQAFRCKSLPIVRRALQSNCPCAFQLPKLNYSIHLGKIQKFLNFFSNRKHAFRCVKMFKIKPLPFNFLIFRSLCVFGLFV